MVQMNTFSPKTLISFLFVFGISPILQANELETTCHQNTVLGQTVLNIIEGEPISGSFSEQEVQQIKSVLELTENKNLNIKGKFAAVMAACSDNTILQERHSYLTGG